MMKNIAPKVAGYAFFLGSYGTFTKINYAGSQQISKD